MLAGGSATTARVLAAIDGARLAHIAAHGTFRADACHAAAGDPVVTTAGWSFIALGA